MTNQPHNNSPRVPPPTRRIDPVTLEELREVREVFKDVPMGGEAFDAYQKLCEVINRADGLI
ncbi:MAG: hypothetical protein AAF578_00195 [Pseudomonadota bacterium]